MSKRGKQEAPMEAGSKFGRLTVLRHISGIGQRAIWLCECECGVQKEVNAYQMKYGYTRSCGCLRKDSVKAALTRHGLSTGGAPEYSTWEGMKRRCNNPRDAAYKRYGGRGISVCEGLSDFKGFLAVVGFRPSSLLSLDRINNDGNYSCGKCGECLSKGWPLNVRWATWQTQANNRRGLCLITSATGETKTVAEWSRITGISRQTLKQRKRMGLSPEELLMPVLKAQPKPRNYMRWKVYLGKLLR